MSGNTYIRISRNKEKFLVQELDIDTGKGYKIGEVDSLKEARQLAQKNDSECPYPAEYGVIIDDDCFEE